jgi:hypothetical protein
MVPVKAAPVEIKYTGLFIEGAFHDSMSGTFDLPLNYVVCWFDFIPLQGREGNAAAPQSSIPTP